MNSRLYQIKVDLSDPLRCYRVIYSSVVFTSIKIAESFIDSYIELLIKSDIIKSRKEIDNIYIKELILFNSKQRTLVSYPLVDPTNGREINFLLTSDKQ